MTIIINSYNTLSAGTSTITKSALGWLEANNLSEKIYVVVPKLEIFEEFQSKGNLKILKLPVFSGPLKYVFRLLYDVILFPLATLLLWADLSIVMANYSPVKIKGEKIVLMRHSYLVDDSVFNKATFRIKLRELLRRLLFKLTLNTTKIIVVQSDYIKTLLLEKYHINENRVHVLPNPITDVANLSVSTNKTSETISEKIILYVSRFYPHKNHNFLLQIASNYKVLMREKNIKIYITVDPALGSDARAFLAKISDSQLNDIIINIGEIKNQALAEYYNKAKCLFFPSSSETFGNPLVEAMSFDLPIVLPDLAYARAVCGEAALYYDPQNSENAFNKLYALCIDQNLWEIYSNKSRLQVQKFPSVEQWIKTLFSFNLEHYTR